MKAYNRRPLVDVSSTAYCELCSAQRRRVESLVLARSQEFLAIQGGSTLMEVFVGREFYSRGIITQRKVSEILG